MTELNIPHSSIDEIQIEQHELLLLDVRTPAEYEEAHIAGSILHPLSSLDPQKVAELSANKKNCLVICRSGGRAKQAAEKLLRNNCPNVKVLTGGVSAWEARGLPLVRGKKTISLERQVRIAAGTLVLLGALLGAFVSPIWIALSGFVGAGLIFAGVTDTCGMAMLLAKMPWNNTGMSCTNKSCITK
jgi:rhodanese-related sulfurtransferase